MEHDMTSAPSGALTGLPSNIEAERSVLGSILLENESLHLAIEHMRAEHFFREPHQLIFQAMCDLYAKAAPIEVVSIAEILRVEGNLEKVGGELYMSSLMESVTSTKTVEYYAKMLREKAVARELITAAQEVVAVGLSQNSDTATIMDQAEQTLMKALDDKAGNTTVSIKEGLKETLEKLNQVRNRTEGGLTGTTTGFKALDSITMGLQDTDLIVLAARPAMGKTAFSLNVALNAARSGAGVLLFSLEMGVDQLVQRLLAIESGVELTKIRGGFLGAAEWPQLAHGAQKLSELNIFIDETPAINPMEVRSRARKLYREGKLDLLIIDYLQLMSTSRRIDSREQQISEISRSLKGLAKELHIPVIALSQLNRSLENRADKRPQLSDLRESGAIEQDADIIMFVYRDEIYHPNTDQKNLAEIIIGKHRNGPTDTIKLHFDGPQTRFRTLQYGENNVPSY